ncbi:MAG: hypothetical protein J6C37_00945 [Roseburia sp.]|nr:hypothetical protein [Roseburia sp.]
MKNNVAEFPEKSYNKGTERKMHLPNALEAAAEKAEYDAQASWSIINGIVTNLNTGGERGYLGE